MTTLVERTIKKQRMALRSAHNARFYLNGTEYRLQYNGGVGEYISIYGRRDKGKFHYINGFYAYKIHSADEAIDYAKRKVLGI